MEKALLGFAAALCVMAGCITGLMEGKVAIKAVESSVLPFLKHVLSTVCLLLSLSSLS